MPTTADIDLLQEYTATRSESVFAQIVAQHVDMVYSVALRHVGNHHQAEEITQAVFIILARKAGSLPRATLLSGWLFHTARLTAANHRRTEIRRAHREQEAFMRSNLEQTGADVWPQIAPLLDDAIARLGEKDRHAIVLRFVQGSDYREVAAALGTSEEAAQVRVSRAVEKLRRLLTRRGLTLSAIALTAAISANAVQAAPAGLAASVTAAVQSGAAAASTLTLVKGTLKLMAWTKFNVAVGVGIVVLLAYQRYDNSARARQVAEAQNRWQQAADAFAAQETEIRDREQQNAALAKTMDAAAPEIAQLRARQKAAYDAIRSAAGASGGNFPSTLLSATLRNPDARAYLRDQLRTDFSRKYVDVTNEWKLSAENAAKLFDIGADVSMKNVDAVEAMQEGRITEADALKIQAESAAEVFERVRSLLGDDGLEKFKEYTGSFPARLLVKQFQNELGAAPLDDAGRARLLEIIRAEPYEVASALAGDYDIKSLSSPEELEQRFQRQAAAARRIHDQAAEFLTADQLRVLDAMQLRTMNLQKATAARTVQRKF